MVLTIIALVIALAALAFAVFNAVRIHSLITEAERVNYTLKGVDSSVAALKKEVQEIPATGTEGVSYDPKTGTMKIDGDLVVNGQVVGKKGITTKK